MTVTKQTARSHPKNLARAKATQPLLNSRAPPKKSTTKSVAAASPTTAAITNEEISISSVPAPAPK